MNEKMKERNNEILCVRKTNFYARVFDLLFINVVKKIADD